MNIGVLGSGIVGQSVGGKLAELGHSVVLGTRDPANVDEKKGYAPSLGEWLAGAGPNARLGTFAAAAAHGEVVVNALNGLVSVDPTTALSAATGHQPAQLPPAARPGSAPRRDAAQFCRERPTGRHDAAGRVGACIAASGRVGSHGGATVASFADVTRAGHGPAAA